MLIYILKFSGCLALLLLFYKLFLERESIHVFKRFYLLGALFFSLIVPLIVFNEYVAVSPTPEVVYTPIIETETEPETVTVAAIDVPPKLEKDVLDIAPLLWGIYFLGVILFGINFIKNLLQIVRRIRKNPKQKIIKFTRVLLSENYPPHTFFRYIFLNRQKLEANEIPEEVLVHEETHAKQKHSVDVLVVELLQVLFWFNPLIYFTRKSIKLNHEFLADKEVLKNGTDSSTYQNTLLSFMVPKTQNQPLANAINYSSIKKRFTVMKTRTSRKSVILKSFLVLPLLIFLLYGFTETKLVPKYEDSTGDFTDTIEARPSSDNSERSVEIAGLVLDARSLTPLEKAGIYDSEGKLLSETDEKGYFKASFDASGTGEIFFEFTVGKNDYKTLVQKEHWGDLSGEIESIFYFGLKKKETDALELSQLVTQTSNLSYETVKNKFSPVKSYFELEKKMKEFRKNNQRVFFEIGSDFYLVNDSSFIKINSEKDLISIDDKKIVEASNVNGLIDRSDITGMTPLANTNASYAIYTIPVDHVVRPLEAKSQKVAEKIIIKLNRKGQLLMDERLLNISDLEEALRDINTKFSFEERKKSVQAVIIVDTDAYKKELKEIEQILESYGIAQIDIVGSENSPLPPPEQNGVTKNQLSKYNRLAKKYNAQPKAKRKIPSKDLRSLETIYRKMSQKQKADAQPFPECGNPESDGQEGATEYQMAEYNALAKKYNEMLADGGNIRIRKFDVDLLEYVHGLMTETQRANAEPLPDFPEPPEPPAPPSPTNPNAKEFAENKIHEIIANQDPHDYGLNNIRLNEPYISGTKSFSSPNPKVFSYFDLQDKDVTIYRNGKEISYLEMERMQKAGEIETINVSKNANEQKIIRITTKKKWTGVAAGQNSGWSVSSGANRDTRNVQNSAPIPPVAPTIAIHLDKENYSKELKNSIHTYLEANKDYEKAVNEYRGKGKGTKQNLWELYNQAMEKYVAYHVLAKEEGNFVQPVPAFKERAGVKNESPPAPPFLPKPKAPLDYVIEMAKKDARFYYEGKEISSDRAIELMKKNKNLNIDSRREKGERPVVKLSTEPIIID